jgi:hypothetical protein
MADNVPKVPYQANHGGGIFGFFSRLFVATPTYRGDGQPPPRGGGGLLDRVLGGTPAYRSAPPMPVSDAPTEPESPAEETCESHGPITIVITPD